MIDWVSQMRGRVVALLVCLTALGASTCGPVAGEPIVRKDGGQNTLEDGLVGYWKLDEALADEPVADSSAAGNTGTPINQPQPSPTGAPVRIPNGGSRSFEVPGQLIDLGNPPALAFVGEVTLAAWVYLTSIPTECAVMVAHGYRRGLSAELYLRVSGGECEVPRGPMRWSVGTWDGEDHMAATSLLSTDLGVWIHWAGTFDGRAWHLYKNGSESAVHVHGQGASAIDAPWGIGGRPSADPTDLRSFPGRLDEVRVYRRALSPSEILELYRL